MDRAGCHAHPETRAVASCSRCFVALCSVCRQFDGIQSMCADCLRRGRRKRLLGAAVALLLGAGACAGGYWLYAHHKGNYDYGRRAAKVSQLEAELGREPCDRPKAEALLNELLAAGDSRGVLVRAEQFWGKCGEFLGLRSFTYQAHANLGEFDQAAADVTKLIEAEPSNESAWVWRGLVFQDKGDLEHAAEDFRQALVLNPRLSDVPLNLANVYERMGRFCDACFPLEQLVFKYPEKPWIEGIRARIEDLARRGDCRASAASSQHVVIRLAPGENAFRAKAQINDRDAGTFIIDTGASYVALTRALADRVGVKVDGAPELALHTANGTNKGSFVNLPVIVVEGLTARHVPAVVVDNLGPGVDGLLGLSFLARFELRQAQLVMEIFPPGSAGAGSR